MKSIFTLLIVNFIFLSSSSQTAKQRFHDTCNQLMSNPFIIDMSENQNCNNGVFNFPFAQSNQQDSWMNPNFELMQSLDSVITEYYDNDEWIIYYLSEYAYNPKGFNTQSVHHELNEEESDLTPYYKSDFYFDENGNVTIINHSRQDEIAGFWEYFHKTTYTYDVDNTLTSYILYGRNESNTDWIPFHKVEYDYDLNGNIIVGRSFGWDDINEDWDLIMKEDFIYDENAYLMQRTSYTLMGSDEWRYSRKTEYVNDQDGNTLQRTSYISLTGDDWEYNTRTEQEFNFTGLLTKVVYTDWVDSTGQWVNDIRQDYNYDPYENLIESMTFTWDTISNNWLSVSKAELAYNLNFILDDLLLPTSWPEFGISDIIFPLFKNMLTEVAYYTIVDTTWKIEDRETYYYSQKDISDVPLETSENITIYPNPADDLIKITGTDASSPILIELFSLQGKLLLKYENPASNRIDVSQMENGLYICKISQKGQTTNHKILIR